MQKAAEGAGIRILTQTISSPTLADQLQSLLKLYPQAKWHVYEPVNRDNVLAGAQVGLRAASGDAIQAGSADVIVSLDADFLVRGIPGSVAMREISPSGAILMRQHEPAVCGREHAQFDGSEGRPSAAVAGSRD